MAKQSMIEREKKRTRAREKYGAKRTLFGQLLPTET